MGIMAGTRKFDPDHVLQAAMETFWRVGYQGASIDLLVRETGIGRGSMYNSFGDKHGLFLSALDHYDETICAERLGLLLASGSPKAVLRAFIDHIARPRRRDRRDNLLYGCLMTHSAVELCPDDPYVVARVDWNLQKLEGAFRTLLQRGRDAGEISDAKDLDALARFLTVAVQGLLVTARGFSEESLITDSIDVIMASLD